MGDEAVTGVDGFPARLRAAREAAGQSQRDVASAVGVAQPQVTAYEAGAKRPTYETAERLAAFLGVRAGWLVFGEEPRERPR